MRRSWMQVTGICLVVAFAVFAVGARAQSDSSAKAQEEAPNPRKALGVGFTRSLLTAEMTFYYGGKNGTSEGRFASLQELENDHIITNIKNPSANSDGSDAAPSTAEQPVPGYHLDLVVAGDGQSFAVALHDMDKADQGWTIFSDQHGVIYFGQPLR